jgi:protein-S-isoprenylcysteine O-methyltransferase Ste14
MSNKKDNPGVIMPPPIAVILTITIGLLLERFFPIDVFIKILSFSLHTYIGIIISVTGLILLIVAVLNFKKIGTNAPPWMPTLKISTKGIYHYTRNPMYVGFFFLIAGIGVIFASGWIFILLLPYCWFMHYGVIKREERYLKQKFGQEYLHYKSSTPRYFGRADLLAHLNIFITFFHRLF